MACIVLGLNGICLGDLLRESLLSSRVCFCALLACNVYLDEMVFCFGRFCGK